MLNPKVENLMKTLDLTEEEALQLIADDEAVDRMKISEVNDDMSAEQQAVMKESRRAENKKPVKAKRERKENSDKRHLIGMIKVLFDGLNCNVNVTNPERELTFTYNGVNYKIVLSAPRS